MAAVAQAPGDRLPDTEAPPSFAHVGAAQTGAGASAVGRPQAALGLHKGIATGEGSWERPTACERWPEKLRLQSTLGDLIPGRCKATNLCEYCAMLTGIENCEVLWQDALTNTAPTLWTVLGTRAATLDMATFRTARTMVLRAARESFPEAECATLVEYTTGYGDRAGGKRRPHWNFTWKGVEDAEKLHAVILDPWLRHVDATRKAHAFDRCVRPIHEMGGLSRYLADHLTKESQRPPKGFRGHRFRTSRGYLAEPLPQAREKARDALRLRRELWKLRTEVVVGADGQEVPLTSVLDAWEIDQMAQRNAYEKAELGWQLVRLVDLPDGFDADGQPTGYVTTPLPVR